MESIQNLRFGLVKLDNEEEDEKKSHDIFNDVIKIFQYLMVHWLCRRI